MTTIFRKTAGYILVEAPRYLVRWLRGNQHDRRVDILRGFKGVVEGREMLLVLGPRGSGCSKLLKSLLEKRQDPI